jgi:phage terminase large subunit-like protein
MEPTMNPLDVMAGLRLEDGRAWGDAAAPFQVDDAEAIFDDDGPPWHYLTRPRGGSKTSDLAGVAIAWLVAEAQPGARGYIVAADRDQGALMVDAAAGFVDRTPALKGVVEVGSFKISGRSGASVEVLAADGASAFGLRPSLMICDEFAQWEETRNVRRVWSAVLSSVNKIAGCRMVILTSAGVPSHMAATVLKVAKADPSAWRVNEVPGPLPWADLEGLAAQRALLLDSEYRRLHLNQWAAPEDTLVSPEDLEAAMVLAGEQAPRPGVRYFIGVDIGLRNDATVVSVVHLEPVGAETLWASRKRRAVLDRMVVLQGSKGAEVDLARVEEVVLAASKEYNNAPVRLDPWQGIGVAQRLRRRNVRVEEWNFTVNKIGGLARTLYVLLRDRLLWLPDDAALLGELATVRLKSNGTGALRIDHDSGRHDDRVISLGLAATAALETVGWAESTLVPRRSQPSFNGELRALNEDPSGALQCWASSGLGGNGWSGDISHEPGTWNSTRPPSNSFF